MPDEVWNRLRRYGNMQVAVDAREAVIADVEAFVKKFRRLPKCFVDRKPACSEEANLMRRLQKAKSRFDDDQQVRLIAVEEQCHAAIQDGKRVAWRMLLDDVSQFVRDSRRWPCRQKSAIERCRNLDLRGKKSYLKEELLSVRLAKTTKGIFVSVSVLQGAANTQEACATSGQTFGLQAICRGIRCTQRAVPLSAQTRNSIEKHQQRCVPSLRPLQCGLSVFGLCPSG